MAAIITDHTGSHISVMSHSTTPSDTTDNPLACLPAGYVTINFSSFKRLATAAKSIYDNLQNNSDDGNQYLVVLSLSKYALDKLKNEPGILGVTCRFEFDDSMAIIKVLPGFNHEVPVAKFCHNMGRKLAAMGTSDADYLFAGATLHKGTVSTKGKEPDQCFHPLSRKPLPGQQSLPWPTLVIEAGNSESMPALRRDAEWWFHNSRGDVRIVLLMKIKKTSRTIEMEKWQLAPPNTPPLTRAILDGLRQANPPTAPPLVQQAAANQQLYSIQEITITPNTATGQLWLPFHAVYDRPPVPPETDFVFTQADLMLLAEWLL